MNSTFGSLATNCSRDNGCKAVEGSLRVCTLFAAADGEGCPEAEASHFTAAIVVC